MSEDFENPLKNCWFCVFCNYSITDVEYRSVQFDFPCLECGSTVGGKISGYYKYGSYTHAQQYQAHLEYVKNGSVLARPWRAPPAYPYEDNRECQMSKDSPWLICAKDQPCECREKKLWVFKDEQAN